MCVLDCGRFLGGLQWEEVPGKDRRVAGGFLCECWRNHICMFCRAGGASLGVTFFPLC